MIRVTIVTRALIDVGKSAHTPFRRISVYGALNRRSIADQSITLEVIQFLKNALLEPNLSDETFEKETHISKVWTSPILGLRKIAIAKLPGSLEAVEALAEITESSSLPKKTRQLSAKIIGEIKVVPNITS